jgi:hypothetical protein
MTELELHLRLAGAPLVVIGLGHVILPRVLGWSTELAPLSALSRQVAYVHAGFIGLMCVLFGSLPLLLPGALLSGGSLAAAVLTGYVVFWGCRLLVQLAVYDSAHWRGDRDRTLIHVAITALWSYETGVYGLALWRTMQLG